MALKLHVGFSGTSSLLGVLVAVAAVEAVGNCRRREQFTKVEEGWGSSL